MRNSVIAILVAFVLGALVSGGVIYFVFQQKTSVKPGSPPAEQKKAPQVQPPGQVQSQPQMQSQPQVQPKPQPQFQPGPQSIPLVTGQPYQNPPTQFQPVSQPLNQPQVSGLPMNPPQGNISAFQTMSNAPTGGGSDQLSQLLLSSSWCAMSYSNAGSTYATMADRSGTVRISFSPNGTFSVNTGGESYSSGEGGLYYGGSQGAEGGYWKVENGRLLMASNETGGQFIDVGLQVNRNSNGYPILVADGTEYSMCQ